MPDTLAFNLVLTTALTGAFALAASPLAARMGLMDHPTARKQHQRATPLVGGIAIFGALLPMVLWVEGADRYVVSFTAATGLLLIVGVIDDLGHLNPVVRFAAGIIAALIMVYGGEVLLRDFGRLFYDDVFGLGPLAVPITVFATLGVINAFNMIDGMDGLSGALFVVAAVGMAVFGFAGTHAGTVTLLLLTTAAVVGFLILNSRTPWNARARVFLGDAGSTLLGFILAWGAIELGQGRDRAFMPMTAVWLIAVPLLDTSCLIWERWRRGKGIFDADRRHLHHLFMRAGFSVGQAWLGIVALAVALALLGSALQLAGAPDYVSFYVFMACALGYFFYRRQCWDRRRFLGRQVQ